MENTDTSSQDIKMAAEQGEWQFEEITVPDYERVVYAEESLSGLKAIIAIHSTRRGPSCGGVRLLPYGSKEEALEDVLRLSKGMSYKSALADIGFGGGKSVIIADPSQKTPELFRAMGRFVDQLKGQYIAAKDMNISSKDLSYVRETTPHVLGLEGVEGTSGDPSPVTARGIFCAVRATCEHLEIPLKGLRVAIQGIGHVGYDFAKRLSNAGAELWVCDTNPEVLELAKKELGATVVGLEEIYDVNCDIFSPCARGAVLNEKTIPRLKVRAVVGCANNQLATTNDGELLASRNILYVPDVLVNSGGIINIFVEFEGYDPKRAMEMTDNIYQTTLEVLERAKKEKALPFKIADTVAQERLK